MELVEFLLARIAEDEALALAATSGTWVADGGEVWTGHPSNSVVDYARGGADDADHIARWDPARVLAECEAKRRIVEAESRWRRTKDNVIESETRKIPDDTVRVIWDEGGGHLHEESMTQQEFRDRFTVPAPPSDTLRFLALPYADHPDYDPEWKP